MGHRPKRRDAVEPLGEKGRRTGEAGEVACAGRHEARLGAVRTPQPEIDQELSGRRQHQPRGLRRNQRLEMQQVDEAGLDELGLRQRRGHAQDRLVGEECRALRHGVDVAPEPERCEIIEKRRAESPGARKPGHVVRREAQALDEPESVLEACGQEKSAPRRQLAEEKLENGGARHPMIEIRLQHVQLVEVGEKGAGGLFHDSSLAEGRRQFLEAGQYLGNSTRSFADKGASP